MKRLLLIILLWALALVDPVDVNHVTAHEPTTLTLQGNGSIRRHRMPFLATQTGVQFTQGWNSPPGQGSHQGQYATDWATGSSFALYAATEGNATCVENDGGWGNRVDNTRTDGKVERYAHLVACPFTGTKHFEQGDFLAWSGTSGNVPNHLHYEVFSGGQSVSHNLSQFFDFDDVTLHRNPVHHHHPSVADNAGPGVNAAGNLTAWNKIWAAYNGKGHYFASLGGCPPNLGAWDCFGSSLNFLGEGFLANRSCLGASNDCGWHQDFEDQDTNDLHDFNWPEACPNAYWLPHGFYLGWLGNTQLGQARSDVYWDPFFGGYAQNFRHGYLVSSSYTDTAIYYSGQNTTCS